MKILTAKQLKTADETTLKNQKISSVELMERAATLAFQEIHASLNNAQTQIKVFCGVGNNGGDGLVIARLLLENGYDVTTFVVNYSDNRSEEFLANYDRIKEIGKKWPELLTSSSDLPKISENDLVIDAIFGIGLNRSLDAWVANLISHINRSNAFLISIDMPSGLFFDKIPVKKEAAIKANVTLTFQTPKLVFFLPQTASYVGDFYVIDIGLDREYLQNVEAEAELIGKEEVLPMYRPRKKFSHKGTYGHVLVAGGSYGKMGSVVLASTAALRVGAGMVTAMVPKCGYSILQTALPEAMVVTSETENFLSETAPGFEPDVVCFGMGAEKNPETVKAFENILNSTKKPMLIDADGLNMLSENPEMLKKIPKNSILTPHPKELERLLGIWKDDFDKLKKAKAFSKKHKIILVIKGAHSIVVEENKLYINTTGNPGMATAGSGDVLVGTIAGLLSQGYYPLTAAVFGVYLHGKAGDIAAGEYSFEGMIAGDIPLHLGDAVLDLFQRENNPPPPEEKPE
ncbi:MAG TPA: NAD(P)H-hydrate dehydratase [Flavobacteriaceae bacterium]|nr:NAD(P)H-hydrate dehydratase [Flavobacteriaceae bacterium]